MLSDTLFGTLGLSETLLKSLSALNYTAPTPIQQQAIPAVLFGKDVLGIADTGSGKTLSYALPILQRLQEEKWNMQSRHVPVLVLVPTRELAVQVETVFNEVSAGLPEQGEDHGRVRWCVHQPTDDRYAGRAGTDRHAGPAAGPDRLQGRPPGRSEDAGPGRGG